MEGAFEGANAEEAQSDAASFVTWDHIPVYEARSDTASDVTTGQWDHIPVFEAEVSLSHYHYPQSTIQPEASVLMW